MKWYEFLTFTEERSIEGTFQADSAYLGEFGEEAFFLGRPIDRWNPEIWFSASEPEHDGPPEDILFNDLAMPIFSERLREGVSKVMSGVQYLPIKVYRPDTSEIPGFSIVNILNRVPALVVERSMVTYYEADYLLPHKRGKIDSLRKPTLRGSALKGLDIIRLDEYPLPIFVSERFKHVLDSGDFLTSAAFYEVKVE